MRTYTKEKRTTEYDKLDTIICDWCEKPFKTEFEFDGKKSSYDKKEFSLEWEEGDNFPEGGSSTTEKVELCHECRKKLKEEIIKLGIKINKYESDW